MRNSIACPYCADEAVLLPDSTSVYGCNRGPLWICRPCEAWVGCHPGTYNALGRLANAELRKAKMRAHAEFDRLWKGVHHGRKKRRGLMYQWLAGALGIPIKDCHIGLFDVETCDRVAELARAKVMEKLKNAIKLAGQ